MSWIFSFFLLIRAVGVRAVLLFRNGKEVKLQRLNEWEIDEWMLEAEMDFRDSGTLEIQDPQKYSCGSQS
jgi:hypothetical protein